jgi:hypothetical protein
MSMSLERVKCIYGRAGKIMEEFREHMDGRLTANQNHYGF